MSSVIVSLKEVPITELQNQYYVTVEFNNCITLHSQLFDNSNAASLESIALSTILSEKGFHIILPSSE